MKLILRGTVQVEAGVDAAITGCRCDEIALGYRDVFYLAERLLSGSDKERDRIAHQMREWLTHFVPPTDNKEV